MNRPVVSPPAPGVGLPSSLRSHGRPAAARTRPEILQRRGKVLVVAGWITAMLGVALYCLASFAADPGADLPDMLRAVPATRAGFMVIGAGTLAWVIGSVMHLDAALDAGDQPSGPDSRRDHP